MDLFNKVENELKSLLNAEKCFRDDNGTDLDQCAKVTPKKGRIIKINTADIDCVTKIREVHQEEACWYL